MRALVKTRAVIYNKQVMGHVLKPERRGPAERSAPERPLVFVDTNVIIDYLRGEPAARRLFSAEAHGRASFVINPIVLQELLLATDAATHKFERIRDHLRVLPLDFGKAEALLTRLRTLRNRVAHSNDFLIMSSADECDFLVTRDERLKDLVTNDKPQVVTPEELVIRLRAA
jgi:predicted nucleic acid-binding protein